MLCNAYLRVYLGDQLDWLECNHPRRAPKSTLAVPENENRIPGILGRIRRRGLSGIKKKTSPGGSSVRFIGKMSSRTEINKLWPEKAFRSLIFYEFIVFLTTLFVEGSGTMSGGISPSVEAPVGSGAPPTGLPSA